MGKGEAMEGEKSEEKGKQLSENEIHEEGNKLGRDGVFKRAGREKSRHNRLVLRKA